MGWGPETVFPVVDSTAGTAGAPVPPESAAGQKPTVLIVEDDVAVRWLVKMTLFSCGCKVLEAGSAEEALLLCERHDAPISLLVSDLLLPRATGPELAKRVLAADRPEMKVLYLSGWPEENAIADGLMESGVAFLQKPFSIDVLANSVHALLSRQGQRLVG